VLSTRSRTLFHDDGSQSSGRCFRESDATVACTGRLQGGLRSSTTRSRTLFHDDGSQSSGHRFRDSDTTVTSQGFLCSSPEHATSSVMHPAAPVPGLWARTRLWQLSHRSCGADLKSLWKTVSETFTAQAVASLTVAEIASALASPEELSTRANISVAAELRSKRL